MTISIIYVIHVDHCAAQFQGGEKVPAIEESSLATIYVIHVYDWREHDS